MLLPSLDSWHPIFCIPSTNTFEYFISSLPLQWHCLNNSRNSSNSKIYIQFVSLTPVTLAATLRKFSLLFFSFDFRQVSEARFIKIKTSDWVTRAWAAEGRFYFTTFRKFFFFSKLRFLNWFPRKIRKELFAIFIEFWGIFRATYCGTEEQDFSDFSPFEKPSNRRQLCTITRRIEFFYFQWQPVDIRRKRFEDNRSFVKKTTREKLEWTWQRLAHLPFASRSSVVLIIRKIISERHPVGTNGGLSDRKTSSNPPPPTEISRRLWNFN